MRLAGFLAGYLGMNFTGMGGSVVGFMEMAGVGGKGNPGVESGLGGCVAGGTS